MRHILLFVAVFFPSFLFAEGSASSAVSTSPALTEAPTSFKEPFSGEALTQLAVGMVVVIVVILILSWALKRFSGISPMTKNMSVIGVLPLSSREKAILIKVGKQHLLLGVAPGRVSQLHAFEEGELELGDVKKESFSQRLAEVVKQRHNKLDGKIDE